MPAAAYPFKLRVEGPSSEHDTNEVRRALTILADPQRGVQLQSAPGWGNDRWNGRGDNIEAAVAWVAEHRYSHGIYFALNPVPPGLDHALLNRDPLCRRWLLIDVDREKNNDNKNHSATDAEHEAARVLVGDIREYLDGEDWPAPLVFDSGNGFHLLYRIDLPNDELSKAILRGFLKALASKFDRWSKAIGAECHDARRVSKLPGTWARKGPNLPDRPHRLTKILHAPTEVEVVPLDLIRQTTDKLGGQEPTAPVDPPVVNGTTTSPFRHRPGQQFDKAYARKAFENEVGRMLLARPGGLNDQAYRSAAALGNFVGAGLLDEEEVFQGLLKALKQAGGNNSSKDADVIRRGIKKGKEEPRQVPGAQAASGTANQPATDKPLTICMADIQPRSVEWLMPDRIPKRFITVLAGRTGVGKSFVSCDIISRITRGELIPFRQGELFEQGSALVISEDSHEYVLAPRFITLGADLKRIRAMTWEAMTHYNLADADMLDQACKEVPDIKVVLIDPPTNFLGEADEHRNAEVRQTVMKVVEWTMNHDLACLFILHVNKQAGKGVDALNRVLGSVAWVTTSRIAHSFTPDPNDKTRCLFVPMKSNLGSLPKALAYRIVPADGVAKVEWIEEVDISADDAMAGSIQPRRVVAAEWLIERFREKREWPANELWAAASAQGVSRNSIFDAKKILNLPKCRKRTLENGNEEWLWWVPENWAPILRSTASDELTPPDEVAL